MLTSYGSPFTIGHKAIKELFDGAIIIQEKIDGSQISFTKTLNGELKMRSKGAEINLDMPQKMFEQAVSSVKAVFDKLIPGFIYRGEYLMKPKHNVLIYDRVPKNYICLFDIEDCSSYESQNFLLQTEVEIHAIKLGFDYAPCFFKGTKTFDLNYLRQLLDNISVLGAQKIEGIVIKNYDKFTADKKIMMGKFVSESFKEIHQEEFRKENPTTGDIKERIIKMVRTPARWNKSIQHLREVGLITGTPKDIGPLIKEIYEDIHKECEEEIKNEFYKYFKNDILRGAIAGFPEWYKEQLLICHLNDEDGFVLDKT